MPSDLGAFADQGPGLLSVRRYTEAYTVPPSQISLVDPTKWIGVYPSIVDESNIVSGAVGSTFNVNLFGYSSLSTVDTTTLPGKRVYPITGVNVTRGITLPSSTYTALTYTWFGKRGAGSYLFAIYGSPSVGGSPTSGIIHDANAAVNTSGGAFVFPVTLQSADTNWHHYAVVMDAAGGTVTTYRDGVVSSTRAFSGPLSGIQQVGFATDAGNTQNGTGYGFTMYAGAMSASAVAALSAGRLPDSSGALF